MKYIVVLSILFIFYNGLSQKKSITDIRDSKIYKIVEIGSQIWMAENLNVSIFRNGDEIPEARTLEEWKKAGKEGTPAWCYYENDANNGITFGKLYNWYAVNDPRGLAPVGWHIPSDNEWTTLENFLGTDAGKQMKSKSEWGGGNCKTCGGSNKSGFSGLPGGYGGGGSRFYSKQINGSWWSSSEWETSKAYSRSLNNFDVTIFRGKSEKEEGMSVRCVKD
jgi:uncharacterized protein (TIGR02145 family)